MFGSAKSGTLSRRFTVALAILVASASWVSMAAVLGYAGMQHALQLTAARAAEVGSGYVAGAVTAMVVSWVGGIAVRLVEFLSFAGIFVYGSETRRRERKAARTQ